MTIKRGEFIALLGPSGCGKSTALNCIAGLLPLSGGSIMLDDVRIDTLPPERRGFGMVFQNYALFPHMSVDAERRLRPEDARCPRPKVAPRVAKALKLVQLTGQEHKLPGQLSGGQQQRVAIARAIVIEPPLVLMDEPLSNLDAKLRIETRAEIRRIHRELGRATIYVTHDQDEALSLADRIVVMKDGVAQQIAPPEEVYLQPSNLDVARFMGYRNVLELDVAGEDGDRVTLDRTRDPAYRHAQAAARQGARAAVAMRPDEVVARRRRSRQRDRGRGDRTSNTAAATRSSTSARRAASVHARAHAAASARRRADARRACRSSARSSTRPGSGQQPQWPPLRRSPASRSTASLLLVAPAALFMLLLFIYPFSTGCGCRSRRRTAARSPTTLTSSRPTICGRRSGRRSSWRCRRR